VTFVRTLKTFVAFLLLGYVLFLVAILNNAAHFDEPRMLMSKVLSIVLCLLLSLWLLWSDLKSSSATDIVSYSAALTLITASLYSVHLASSASPGTELDKLIGFFLAAFAGAFTILWLHSQRRRDNH
jgi:hypothetical protein